MFTEVVGPVLGPIFGPKSDFFGVVPGVFPGGLGIVDWYSREVLGVFEELFPDFFGSCSGTYFGKNPALPDGF